MTPLTTEHSFRKRTVLILLALLIALVLLAPPVLLLLGLNSDLAVVRYTVDAPGVSGPIRIALVTDLHACVYGENQAELLEAIDREAPDLVLLGGDIFDHKLPQGPALTFLREIGARYPCCFVTGNHEYFVSKSTFNDRMARLSDYGIRRLSGTAMTLEIRGARICLCGVDDPFAWSGEGRYTEHTQGSFRQQLAQVADLAEDGVFTVLLSHRPEMLDEYAALGFDLVLSGHTHGGQWRIPGLINGLWAPNQGLLPRLAGGLYRRDGTTMIVSRGLARESTWVPRIYNRPELVIVDLAPAATERPAAQ